MLAEQVAVRPAWRLGDFIQLGKPRLSALVLFTTGIGAWFAPGHEVVSPWMVLGTLLCTAWVVLAANSLNSYFERDIDACMHRTRKRPLPTGAVSPRAALWWSTGLTLASVPALAWVSNPLTGLLGGVALAIYAFAYTPLKRVSSAALWLGGVPGAMPPLIGWTAVTGEIQLGGVALFALMYVWQVVHFLAIAIYLQEDYRRGGIVVLPAVVGRRATLAVIVMSAIGLLAVSLWPVGLGLASTGYAVVAVVLGLAMLALSVAGYWAGASLTRWARQLFLATLVYLTILMTVLVAGG